MCHFKFLSLRLQYTFRGDSRTSASGLKCRYVKPYIKLKFRTGYQTIPTILKRNELSNFSRLLNASAWITFWTLHVGAKFVFRLFNVTLSFRAQSAKKLVSAAICHIHFSETLQNIFEIGLRKYEVFVQKSLSLKEMFRKKKIADTILLFMC